MIFFLYGEDSYRSQRKLNEIIERFKKSHKSGLNLTCFDLEESDSQDFKKEIYSASIFKEKKLIILKNASLNKDFKEELLEDIKKIAESEDIVLFYESVKISKDKFSKLLEKHGKSQEFDLLEGDKLEQWVKKELENSGAKITESALEKLIRFVGDDLWQMENEIKKLVNYKKGEEIESDDVEVLVKPKIETDIFKTIDSLASKNKKQAIELIHRHLEKGDPPLYLFSMINFQFRNLLMIKDSKFGSGRINLHPYVIKKTTEQARKFSFEELKKIYQKIFEVDLAIKTGKLKQEEALDLLISEI